MTDPTNPNMRIVSEPAPPLDEHGELVLDDELCDLAEALATDAQHLSAMAAVSNLGAQLRKDASRLSVAAGATDACAPPRPLIQSASEEASRSNAGAASWRPVWRVVPLAAAVLVICLFAVPPSPPQPITTISIEPTPATRTPTTAAPVRHAAEAIPWQELTSPELEGALDLVDETISISI